MILICGECYCMWYGEWKENKMPCPENLTHKGVAGLNKPSTISEAIKSFREDIRPLCHEFIKPD